MKKIYNYLEQLEITKQFDPSVRKVLAKLFPDNIGIEMAEEQDDIKGTDYWVTLPSTKKISVDIKLISQDYAVKPPKYPDILVLEIWSSQYDKFGWTRDPQKHTDYVCIIQKDTLRATLLPFLMLYYVFTENLDYWKKIYPTHDQTAEYPDGSIHTAQTINIPRKVIWDEIYKNSAGALMTNWETASDQDKRHLGKQINQYDANFVNEIKQSFDATVETVSIDYTIGLNNYVPRETQSKDNE